MALGQSLQNKGDANTFINRQVFVFATLIFLIFSMNTCLENIIMKLPFILLLAVNIQIAFTQRAAVLFEMRSDSDTIMDSGLETVINIFYNGSYGMYKVWIIFRMDSYDRDKHLS